MINVIAYTFSTNISFKFFRVISRVLYFDSKLSRSNLYVKTHINNIEFWFELLDTMMNVFILTKIWYSKLTIFSNLFEWECLFISLQCFDTRDRLSRCDDLMLVIITKMTNFFDCFRARFFSTIFATLKSAESISRSDLLKAMRSIEIWFLRDNSAIQRLNSCLLLIVFLLMTLMRLMQMRSMIELMTKKCFRELIVELFELKRSSQSIVRAHSVQTSF
jgi:hypothetical protein